MKPGPFDYCRPSDIAEAVAILQASDNAKILAGGQSLVAMLNLRYLVPDLVLDINGLTDLSGISIGGSRSLLGRRKPATLRIGAMTRQRDIEIHADLQDSAPIFAEALAHVGHRQTRNRGTIGGSVCHLDPAAELPLLCLIHDASMEVAGEGGTRHSVPISEFIAGYMTPKLSPHEILTAIEMQLWPEGHGHAFCEFSRRHGDFAIASAACLVEMDRKGAIARVAIGIGGLGSVPMRLPGGEAALRDTAGAAQDISRAVRSVEGLEILGDFHGGKDYRLSVARTMLRKSLTLAIARAKGKTA